MKPNFNWVKKGLLASLLVAGSSVAKAQGPVRAMYSTNTTPQAFNLGTAIRDSLAFTDFTVEMWVKIDPTSTSGNPPLLGNKNYTSGGNTGICLTYTAASNAPGSGLTVGGFRFNFKTQGGTSGSSGRHDYDIKPGNANQWNHIAFSVDRQGEIRGYVNGIYQSNKYNNGQTTGVANPSVAADAALSIATNALTMYLAQDGTGSYPSGFFFKGAMDEVRIWKTARTQQELRENMCHKLTGNEAGLMAYYKLDEMPGSTTISNSASAFSTLFNGTATNTPPTFIASGEPVGDTSVNLDTSNWNAQSLQLGTTNRGVFTVDSFSNTGSFLHLYQVNTVPDSTTGLTAFSNNNVSFGVFDGADSFQYYPRFNYSNYANAVSFQNTVAFFGRKYNDVTPWTFKANLYNNTTTHILRTDSVKGSRQFFLANFLNNCNTAPTALSASSITSVSAILGWTTGSSATWNIQYGTSGFTLGNGTTVAAVSTNPYTITGLQPNTAYSFYVKDTCIGVGSSAWAGPYNFTTAPDYSALGSGHAMQCSYSSVNAFNLGTALRDSLATNNFSVEMWVKIDNAALNTGTEGLIGNKNYVSGGNTGFFWHYTGSASYNGSSSPVHNFRFNFATTAGSSSRRDVDMMPANEYTWNHYAITVDRSGVIKGYINGVLRVTSASIAANAGQSIASTFPVYLAQDGTGTWGATLNPKANLNGSIDEVRIWKKLIDTIDIRSNMCHRLQGNEQGLLAYYRLDELSGSTSISNSATAMAGAFNGTATTTPPAFVVSGAPIGDTSVFVYPTTGWNGVALSLNSNGQGVLSVDSILAGATSSIPGVHIYRINQAPNFATGIANIGSTNRFFGVFTTDNVAANYHAQYNYSSYPNAVSNAANLHLYNRPDNAVAMWAQLPAVNNTTANTINRTSQLGTRQYLLADFAVTPTCAAPTNVKLDSATNAFAKLSWTSAAASHKTKYGLSGFNFGTAADTTVSVNTRSLTGLTQSTFYDFYVQDSCGAGSKSAWVGPFTFQTQSDCPNPVNVHADSLADTSLTLSWTDLATQPSGYAIAWGTQGTFTSPDSAAYLPVFATQQNFTGLTPGTTYTFYVRVFCSGTTTSASGWAGPFSFTTKSPTGIMQIVKRKGQLQLYPNPATDIVTIAVPAELSGNTVVVTLYNSIGAKVYVKEVKGNTHTVATTNLPDGVYHVVLASGNEAYNSTLIIHNR